MADSRGLVNDNGSAFGNCCDFESTLHACGVVRALTWELSGLKANSNNERKNREQRADGLMDCSAKDRLSSCREEARKEKIRGQSSANLWNTGKRFTMQRQTTLRYTMKYYI
jgi:hypothetical protein